MVGWNTVVVPKTVTVVSDLARGAIAGVNLGVEEATSTSVGVGAVVSIPNTSFPPLVF